MKILLTGGGTAGHVMPHLALLNDFRKHFNEIIYIGQENGIEKDIIHEQKDIKYYPIEATKFVRRKILKNLLIPFRLLKSIHSAKKVIKQERPDIIFSKGGFVSLPVVIAGKKLKIPIVAHESDLEMGLANKLSKPSATVICTTFEKTASSVKNKGKYTGSPMRDDLFKDKKTSREKLGIHTNKPVLLVTGGSQGSKSINNKIREELKEITDRFYVVHLTGKNNIDNKINMKDYKQIDFTLDMGTVLSSADIVVSRAGSNTIFELAVLRKPMLLIPLPKGTSRGDQVDNAKYFNSLGYANFVTEDQLEDTPLLPYIIETYKESPLLVKTLEKSNIQPGNKVLVETILELVK